MMRRKMKSVRDERGPECKKRSRDKFNGGVQSVCSIEIAPAASSLAKYIDLR